jgi:hypothetical protein
MMDGGFLMALNEPTLFENQGDDLLHKFHTIPFLMHQTRISTTDVSSN